MVITASKNAYIFFLLNASVFLDTLLYGIIVPVIPYYSTTLGIETTSLGLMFAFYSAGLLLFSLPAGIACDRFGYKPVLLTGMLGLTISTIAFIPADTFWLLSACRLIQGISGAATWAASLAMAAAMYPPRERGKKMGIMMTFTGMGTIIGPLLGGFMNSYVGYSAPFITTSFASAGLCFFLFFSTLPVTPRVPRNNVKNIVPVLRNRNIAWGIAIIVLSSFGFGMIEPLLPLDLYRRFGVNSAVIGTLFGTLSLSYALSQPIFGILSDRIGRKPPLVWGLVLTSILVPFIGIAPSIESMMTVMLLLGITIGASSTPVLPLLAESIEQANKRILETCSDETDSKTSFGTAYGFLNTGYSVGLLFGPILGSIIVEQWNLTTAIIIYSTILGTVAAGSAFMIQETFRSLHRKKSGEC